MDGQLALGIGLFVLSLSIPITALIMMSIPRRNGHANRAQEEVVRDQDRVRGVQLTSKGQEEAMAGVKVHLSNIDGRLERIEKKIYE